MNENMSNKIAVVGTGLVGRAWAIVFARSGYQVALYDPVDGVAHGARALIESQLIDLERANLLNACSPREVLARISVADSLAEAVDGVIHVQESAPERVEVKRALYQLLDQLTNAQAVLASSTSGIPASQFTEDLSARHRCVVAHPINPPHIIPLVEIVPAPWTHPSIVQRTSSLMRSVGQRPVSTTREVTGFIANRLQGALLSEAFRLVEDGVCTAADIDCAIADGLGLRWCFIGPMETIDLNSPNGVRGYCDMLGELYFELAKERVDARRWDDALVSRIEAERREALPATSILERQRWRDRRLAQLVSHKREMEKQDSVGASDEQA